MSVITWSKQGGRRYAQWGVSSLGTVGIAWTALGSNAPSVSTGFLITPGYGRRHRGL